MVNVGNVSVSCADSIVGSVDIFEILAFGLFQTRTTLM